MINKQRFMKKHTAFICIFFLLFFAGREKSFAQEKSTLLWQIGKSDNNFSEFAFLPYKEVKFVKDGFFIAGKSSVAKDWPYAQPGPDDAWAGNTPHTNTIIFSIKDDPSKGTYQLNLKFADVGPSDVQLLISVNKKTFEKKLQSGSGNAIWGFPKDGAKTGFTLDIDAGDLKKGNNQIDITTKTGSWLVYDWVGFFAPPAVRLQAVQPSITMENAKALPFIKEGKEGSQQPVILTLVNIGDTTGVQVKAGNQTAGFGLSAGRNELQLLLPAVTKDSGILLSVTQKGKQLFEQSVQMQPARKITVYILPHSHNDIGYTEIQTNVEKKQMNNLLTGIEYAERTKNYPKGARFVWNLEGSYAADLFMNRMNDEQKKRFIDAVKDGGVALNGMYLNTLTGLCRPEELLQLFAYSNQLAKMCGTSIKSAMISDVPGYTWGVVPAMAQAGIRYFSTAPNYFDRIGDILQKWEDKPFWWVGPSGKEKVLVWIPYRGYALSHGLPGGLTQAYIEKYVAMLNEKKFPYDITYIRWSGHGDNAVPDLSISEFVKEWSSKYTWPKFIISSTTTAFQAFEEKYGDKLPEMHGDWTGYWEDGAGSSALETAQNRQSSSRLTQAGALWAMTAPGAYPQKDFHEAWKNVLLYSEHTWGADESVTRPLTQKTTEQWIIKKSYATKADELSNELVAQALNKRPGAIQPDAIDVFNTNSWQRSGLVILSAQLSLTGDIVKDAEGKTLLSQRLSSGELAFFAEDIPPFASRRYTILKGTTSSDTPFYNEHFVLDNGIIRIVLDSVTGAVKSLKYKDIAHEFVDVDSKEGLNDYLFLEGKDLSQIQRINNVEVDVKENGPLLSSLVIKSQAPGCTRLTREVRLIKGADYIEINNLLDKKPAELNPYPGDYGWANTKGKESLNIAFPFHVPGGEIKMDIPLAIMQPEKDQIPSACKNWLETGNWVDVSNKDLGISLITLDAPLIEVGGITATMLGGQTNPAVWRKTIEPTQRIYSWALNNHWETNYRAYQLGEINFRYIVRPHKNFDEVSLSKFATGFAQSLIAAPAIGKGVTASMLQLSNPLITVVSLRPSQNGKAYMLTLYNPGLKTVSTSLQWNRPVGNIYLSNTAEETLEKTGKEIELDSQGVRTLKIELPAGSL